MIPIGTFSEPGELSGTEAEIKMRELGTKLGLSPKEPS